MSLLFLKFKVKTFSQLKTSLSFFIGADIMIYGPVDDHKNLDKASAWMSLHNQIVEKFKSKMSVVAWIHFGENEINSIDLHTQKMWSNECPEIIEIVIQEKDKSMNCYGLTKEGESKLSQCRKPVDQIHYECQSNAFRESKIDSVEFIEGPIEVVHDIFEVLLEDPMVEKSNHNKLNQYIIPNNVIEKFLERAQTVRKKTLAFLAGQKEGNIITVTHLFIPTQQKYKPPIWGHHNGM